MAHVSEAGVTVKMKEEEEEGRRKERGERAHSSSSLSLSLSLSLSFTLSLSLSLTLFLAGSGRRPKGSARLLGLYKAVYLGSVPINLSKEEERVSSEHVAVRVQQG